MMIPHTSRSTLIAIAATTFFALLATTPVLAQDYDNIGSTSMRARHKARLAELRGEDKEKAEQNKEAAKQYPDATRKEPEAKASRDNLKKLQKLQEMYQSGNYANTITLADKIAAGEGASAYDKAFAWQIAGSASAQSGDETSAVQYFQKALASDSLDNNSHYAMMFNLAATQYGMGHNEQALATLERFLKETKSSKPEQLNLRGALLANVGRYDEAADLYKQLMQSDPANSKTYLMNAVAAYQQGDKQDKAAALLSRAQAEGKLTEPNQYRALYVTYINQDKNKQALAVIDDGIAKGIIKPSPELAKDYMVLGQKAYYAEDDAMAIEMYKRAAPMAADGEAALNLALIYAEKGRKAEARAAAEQALAKGVKDTKKAKQLAAGK